MDTPQTMPPLPIIRFSVAAFVDTILAFIIATITLILPPLGWVLGVFVGALMMGFFFLCQLFHPNPETKKLGRFSFRAGIAFTVNIFPLLRLIIPEWTTLVVITYLGERRAAKKKQTMTIPEMQRG